MITAVRRLTIGATLTLTLSAIALLPVARPAAAHAILIASSPGDKTTLPAIPRQVTLTFTDQLNPRTVEVTVTAPDGTSAIAGPVAVAGSTIRQPLRPSGAGIFTVTWTVNSA